MICTGDEPLPVGAWLAAATRPIAGLRSHGRVGDWASLWLCVSGRWPAHAVPADDVEPLVGAGNGDASAQRATVALLPHGIAATTDAMGLAPVYLIVSPDRCAFGIATDPCAATAIAVELGLSDIALRRERREGAVEPGVTRIGPGVRAAVVEREGRWSADVAPQPDLLSGMDTPAIDNAATAGSMFLGALEKEFAVLAALCRRRPVDVLLSGGVDSATIAWLAVQHKLRPRAVSLGTPWGDEFEEAQEVADHLNIPLQAVRLSEHELVAAAAEVIRWTGIDDPGVVELAIVGTACVSRVAAPGSVVLTGYGNDLLNAGMWRPEQPREQLAAHIRVGLEALRYSDELAPGAAVARDIEVIHPYLLPGVVTSALAISTDCKLAADREKGYFRIAMEPHLPRSAAWRPKVAAHHGNGLEQGLARVIARDAGQRGATDKIYAAIRRRYADAAASGQLDRVLPLHAYRSAVEEVAADAA